MKRERSHRISLISVLVLISQIAVTPARANLITKASGGPTSVTSAKWIAAAASTAASANPLAALSVTPLKSTVTAAGTYFSVNNYGTIALTGEPLTGTVTGGSGTWTNNIQSCSGTWNETAGTCSGTISTVATSSKNTSLAGTVAALALSGTQRLRAQYVATGNLTLTYSITIAVSNSNIRGATTTNH